MTTTIIPAHLNSNGELTSSWAVGKAIAAALDKVESIYAKVTHKDTEHTIHIYSKRKANSTKPYLEEFEIVVKSDLDCDEDTLLDAAEKAAKQELKELEIVKNEERSEKRITSSFKTKEERRAAERNIFAMLFRSAAVI